MIFNSKREILYVTLAGFFITNAIVAEMIGGKLIEINIFNFSFKMSMGIIPWPVVFLATDLINEYFGKAGVRRLSLITAGLIGYSFVLLYAGMKIPAAPFSPVQDKEFYTVFGQSMWIIVGSISCLPVGGCVCVLVFQGEDRRKIIMASLHRFYRYIAIDRFLYCTWDRFSSSRENFICRFYKCRIYQLHR